MKRRDIVAKISILILPILQVSQVFIRKSQIILSVYQIMHFNKQGVVISRTRNICQNSTYETPTTVDSATCCAGEKLTPGISFTNFWNDCATPDESEKMINVTMVRFLLFEMSMPKLMFFKLFYLYSGECTIAS